MSFFGDLAGNFTGGRSRDDLARGRAQADASLEAGLQGGLDEYARGYGHLDEASARLDPYATGGRAGYEAYLASIGLGTDEARKKVQDSYFNDPVQNAIADRVTKANTRAQTGRGMGNSGAATQSLTNALLERWGGHQDRLAGVGSQGAQVAGQQAGFSAAKVGIDTGRGDMRYNTGRDRAGMDISYSNAIAASRNTGINNLFQIGSLATRAMQAAASGSRSGQQRAA